MTQQALDFIKILYILHIYSNGEEKLALAIKQVKKMSTTPERFTTTVVGVGGIPTIVGVTMEDVVMATEYRLGRALTQRDLDIEIHSLRHSPGYVAQLWEYYSINWMDILNYWHDKHPPQSS